MERRKALVIAASVASTTAGAAGVVAVNAGLIGTTAPHQPRVVQLSTTASNRPARPRVVFRSSPTLPPKVTIVYQDVPASTAPAPAPAPRPAPADTFPASPPRAVTAPATVPHPAATVPPITTAPVTHTGGSAVATGGDDDSHEGHDGDEHGDD